MRSEMRRAAWLALSVSAFWTAPLAANELRVGLPAPPVTTLTLDGRHIATRDLTGHVVIVTFWATWCVPCREELPLLSAYAAEHAAAGLEVIAVTLDPPEKRAAVERISSQWHFPVAFLAHTAAPGYGRIWRLPVNFTIDATGRLVDDGWQDKEPAWTRERLERLITPLLSAPP